jgi:hypothetical protein
VIEAKVKDFLKNWLHCNPYDCGTIVECIRNQARVAGYDLNEQFAVAGLGAGPEAEVASAIVARALGCGGDAVTDYQIRKEVADWIRRNPRKGL